MRDADTLDVQAEAEAWQEERSPLTTSRKAAWEWVWQTLDKDEPFCVGRVRELCRKTMESGDALHRRWAVIVAEDVKV